MKIEHVAVSMNSEKDSDMFFMDLLKLKKTRSFTVNAELIQQFFGISKEQLIIRYSDGKGMDFEVFITNDDGKTRDRFTHLCIVIENKDELLERAKSLGFSTIKVPRKDGESYYLFIKDTHGNLYEIK